MTRRGPGWPTVVALALVVLAFSVFHPLQLMMLPLALMLLALPPRRPAMVVAGVLLVGLVFLAPREGLWGVERGWTLIVAGWFLLAVVAWPDASFVSRGVAAVLAGAVSGGALIAAGAGWPALDAAIGARFAEAAAAMGQAFADGRPETEAVVRRAAELPGQLFPGLLAVASLAALAIGWWGYQRVARRGEPLGRLPEFRFPDPLVWVLIAGLVLVAVPLAEWAPRAGGNLLFFMGALYALRGVAVMLALVGVHVPTLVAVGVVGLLLWPIVMTGTLVVGVADTWLDLRAAGRAARDEG